LVQFNYYFKDPIRAFHPIWKEITEKHQLFRVLDGETLSKKLKKHAEIISI